MLTFLPSVLVLGTAAIVALSLTWTRESPPEADAARAAATWALAWAVGIQVVHFVEEALTGFHLRLGDLFGLPDMSVGGFITINLIWIAIWTASIPGLRAGRSFAFFAAWFLAIAGLFNGVFHPLLAIAAAGYFPGVGSSLLIAGVSLLLWLRLSRVTRPVNIPAS